jgi:uncharacterized protein YndB with AHSA1/START domain
MVNDAIEREILIAAPVERVWEILTEAEFLGTWFGAGDPVKIDLRPGGLLLFDHGGHGTIPARFERIEQPRLLSWRWSQGSAGEEPTDDNATLVVFTLTSEPEGDGTRLRLVESGFAGLALPEEQLRTRYEANNGNWPGKLTQLREYVEQHLV